MPAARIDYEVRTLAGRLLFTSDSVAIARRWAETHCPPEGALAVELTVTSHQRCYLVADAGRRVDFADLALERSA